LQLDRNKELMTQEVLNLLALSLAPGLGVSRLNGLLRRFGSPSEILKQPRKSLVSLGVALETQVYLASGSANRDAEEAVEMARRAGVRIMSVLDADYPALLRQVYDPPAVLYISGEPRFLQGPAIAIVGSRRSSVYGEEVALKLARELVRVGLVIVSGMARGIDAKAHQGAMEGSGETVAVLGTGIDITYPREHRRLRQEIERNGCTISEFPYGCHPAPQNFPVRNRIISGLSYGTVIPEASEFSGSLITARLTLEQDRELWAVPGNITNPGSYGPNYLIKQGAKPVLSAQDVLDELPIPVLQSLRCGERCSEKENAISPTLQEEELLAQLPVDKAVHFDRLLAETGIDVTNLNSLLMNLEMKGLIRQLPGRRYHRKL
jgi:DNA processing protein